MLATSRFLLGYHPGERMSPGPKDRDRLSADLRSRSMIRNTNRPSMTNLRSAPCGERAVERCGIFPENAWNWHSRNMKKR